MLLIISPAKENIALLGETVFFLECTLNGNIRSILESGGFRKFLTPMTVRY